MSDEADDDWFEQARREIAAERDDVAADDVDDQKILDRLGEGDGADVADDGAGGTDGTQEDVGDDDVSDDESSEDVDERSDVDGDRSDLGGADTESGEPDEGQDPFGGRSESEDTDQDPFGGSRRGGQEGGATGDQDAFGGGGDQFGGGQDASGGGDDQFGGGQDAFGGGGDGFGGGQDAFGGGGGGQEFGFGGGGDGGSPEEFDEAELDSDIDRIEIGIEGLDEMILGGVPERSLMVAIGSAGTGKTTFGLQFLNRALEDGGKAVYITLEESREAILSTAEEKGWSYREYEDEGRLAVVALDPIEMANSLSSIRNDLSRLIDEFDADRLVLDSVSLLEMMYDNPARRRGEVFDFARSLKEAGVTTMLTSEADAENSYASRYGIVEYLVDAVFVLQYVRPSDFRETRLAVEIQKIRDANHSRETKPYEITNDGISVYRQANIF